MPKLLSAGRFEGGPWWYLHASPLTGAGQAEDAPSDALGGEETTPHPSVQWTTSSLGHGVFVEDLVVQLDPQAWLVRWGSHVAVRKDLDRLF